jgi:sigma-B regulation protein RsbU (phosphoserine phosphatase)
VLNIVVYDRSGAAVATAKGETLFHVTRGTPITDEHAAAAGVAINEFDYEGMPVRGFAKPLSAEEPARRVEVYLSAARIAESRRKLAEAMTRVSVTACLLAAAGAFLLARYLTRPIRVLVKDMKQVSHGDLRHQSKVNSSDEVGDLARAFNAMTSSLEAAQDARIAQRALEHELSLATGIQARLLPTAIPEIPGLDISAYYLSAREVGGDYYDFLAIDPDHVGMVVADVSGKGVPASLIMTMTRSLLRAAAAGETSPARTVETVNQFLSPDMNPGMFVTLLYFVLDARAREVRLARCGHNAPLLYSARSGKSIALQPRGIGLGLDRAGGLFRSELQVQRFTLQPGDVLLAFTDGVVEAKNRAGEDYTEDRLKEVFVAHASGAAGGLVEAILKDLDRHRRGAEQSDDLTILVVRCLPEA